MLEEVAKIENPQDFNLKDLDEEIQNGAGHGWSSMLVEVLET